MVIVVVGGKTGIIGDPQSVGARPLSVMALRSCRQSLWTTLRQQRQPPEKRRNRRAVYRRGKQGIDRSVVRLSRIFSTVGRLPVIGTPLSMDSALTATQPQARMLSTCFPEVVRTREKRHCDTGGRG
jgi:hypothetical protein